MIFKRKSKRILFGLISVVMILGYIGFRVDAEDESKIIYQLVNDLSAYRTDNGYSYEPKDDYVFAGWYEDDQGKDPLAEAEANAKAEAKESAYAKYVPAEVLSVKAQVNETALKDEITDTNRAAIRLLTTVDSLKYEEVGFNVTRGDTSYTYKLPSQKVFSKVRVVGSEDGDYIQNYAPETTFCSDSHYFESVTFVNMPESAVNTDLTATPYWKTLDGTVVEGNTSIKTVNLGRAWIYVNSDSTADKELGTYNAPYTTIASAVGHTTTLDSRIILNSDAQMDSKITVEKNIILTTETTDGVTVKRTGSVNMFEVGSDNTTGDVTFEISGKVTLDGNKAEYANASHMIINRGIFILGKDAVIQNASRAGDGAAIYSNEALVINGTVQDCVNTNANKVGAVKVDAGSISGSGTFKNNVSYGVAGILWMNKNTTATLTNATFSDNQSTGNGGAICNEGNITATGCTFTGNYSSGGNGGAIYNTSNATKLDITESNFTNNYCSTANMSGGAINCASAKGITINIADTTFSENYTTNAGGAIMVSNDTETASTLNMSNCNYEGNYTTKGAGGAIYTYGKITGTSCSFSDNHAVNTGGAIALRRSTSSLTLQMDADETRGTFSSNYSTTANGGAIFVHNDVAGNISITGYDFTDNEAGQDTTEDRNGGAIWNQSSTDKMVVHDSTFTSNKTTNVGGAIGSNVSFTMDKCTFTANSATNDPTFKDIYVPSKNTVTGLENISTDDDELRILISSDVHYSDLETWYGMSEDERMQLWVNSVLAEHETEPLDLVVINGDTSYDYWITGGSVLTDGNEPTTGTFVSEYVSQLKEKGIPVFVMPGNHDQYSDENWKRLTGNSRQGSMVLGNSLFLFLDNYNANLDPTEDSDGTYTQTDVAYINEMMNRYPLCDVYLIAHYFNTASESDAFKQLVAENSRIKGLFHGHTHYATTTQLGEDWGYKTIAQTGNFSWTHDTSNDFWGFRELVITPDESYSQYIQVKCELPSDYSSYSKDRATINRVTYAKAVDTLDELNNAITNVENACTINLRESLAISELLQVNKNILLTSKTGEGVTLTRNAAVTMFEVLANSMFKISGKVTLDGNKENITNGTHAIINRGEFMLGGSAVIQNAEKSGGNGGAIWSAGNLTIDGTLQNNGASMNGGAIYVSAGTVSGEGTFINNSAGSTYAGGAIYINDGEATLTNAVFKSNSAKSGGAIFINTSKTATLTNTVLQQNTSTSNGGAIYNQGNLTLTNCTVGGKSLGNYSSGENGGAIYNQAAATKLDITGSTFTDNYCSQDGKNGGAINCASTQGITINVTDTTFSNNYTTNAGGAIFVYSNTASKLNMLNCVFNSNHAKTGGAIYTYGSTTGNSCGFTGNYTTAEGGAIYIRGASNNLTLNMNEDSERGVFAENYSEQNSGGAIFVRNDLSGTISITGYDFTGNAAGKNTTSKVNGGAICLDGTAQASVGFSNCKFDANTSPNAGGAIRCADTLTVENCKFRNNIATNQGGAIHGGKATIQGKYYFEGNTGGSTYNGIHSDNATFADGATAYDSWDAE